MLKILAILTAFGTILAGLFGIHRAGQKAERGRQVQENAEAHAEVSEVRATIQETTDEEIRNTAKRHFVRKPKLVRK